MAATVGILTYEQERLARIEENRKRLAELGVMKQVSIMQAFKAAKPRSALSVKPRISRKERLALRGDCRRSMRLQNLPASKKCVINDRDEVASGSSDSEREDRCDAMFSDAPLVDLMARRHRSNGEEESDDDCCKPSTSAPANEIRCASQGRGSVYDSVVGITCHFCRQKKLCGEEDCPRCSSRDDTKDCIGKTECAKCHSTTGRFCRACLLLRYGLTIEEFQAAKDTWLCPHCYEEEHPDEGWICNSSICMKRRGLRPTGIAIYEAQQRGFKSVGHLLQDQLRKRGGVTAAVQSGGSLDQATQQPAAEAGPSQQATAVPSVAALPPRPRGRRAAAVPAIAAAQVAVAVAAVEDVPLAARRTSARAAARAHQK